MNKSKHICFITATMQGGGTERVIANLANYYVEQDYNISILLTANGKVEYELNPKISVLQLSEQTNGNVKARIKRLYNIRKYIKKNKETVFYSFGTETNMFVILASIFLKRKIVISERNDPNKCSFKTKRDLLYFIAPKFVFQTTDAMNFFSKRIRKRSIVIPNPVSPFMPECFQGEKKKEIVAVGRLEEQKNHKLLIEAFAEFHEKYPEFTLKIYGRGHLKESLKEQIKNLDLINFVTLADFSTHVLDDIKDAYMYVLSSDYEGISNSLMEAMAMGLAVISTDCPIGGSRMLIEDHKNGLLVPVRNKTLLVKAMLELAADENLLINISREAKDVRKTFSIENVARRWLNIY